MTTIGVAATQKLTIILFVFNKQFHFQIHSQLEQYEDKGMESLRYYLTVH